ncbi:MAG: hypothetical protein ACHQAX_04520 [Gammaproteobacteria bacterium]
MVNFGNLKDYFQSIADPEKAKNENAEEELRSLTSAWLTETLAGAEITGERISTLIHETIQTAINTTDLVEKQALGAILMVLNEEAQAKKSVTTAAAPVQFNVSANLADDMQEYEQIQTDYINAKAAYEQQQDRLAAKQTLQKAYRAKLDADDWLKARFKKVEYGDIVKEGQNELGIAKDKAREAELRQAINNNEAEDLTSDTPAIKAKRIRLKKLKKAENERLKIEWRDYHEAKFFYFFATLSFKLNLRKTPPTPPTKPSKAAKFTVRDWASWAGSIFLNLDNAILCGISVFVGVQALDWPFYSSVGMALASAGVTMAVNLWGFRNNILSLLKKSKKHIPVVDENGAEDTYRAYNIYKFGLVTLTGLGALVFTALAASTVTDVLGINDYWTSTAVIMTFGLTFIATWGLFTQETRKWFEGTDPEHPKRSDSEFLQRTKQSLAEIFALTKIFDLKADKGLIDETQETANTYHLGRSIGRLALFVFITGLTSYIAIMLAPRAAELFLVNGAQNLMGHLDIGTLGANNVVLPILQAAFMISMVIYNATAALKLSTFLTRAFCGLPLASDDGKKHNVIYRFIYPFFAMWNALNNGAFSGTELNKSNEMSNDISADPGTPSNEGPSELTPAQKAQGYMGIVSSTFRSALFFSNTRAGQHAVELQPLETPLRKTARM